VLDSPVAGSLNGSGRGIGGVGGHGVEASDWTRLSSSRGEEGSRRAGPAVLIG
jgi:hypothetical protein